MKPLSRVNNVSDLKLKQSLFFLSNKTLLYINFFSSTELEVPWLMTQVGHLQWEPSLVFFIIYSLTPLYTALHLVFPVATNLIEVNFMSDSTCNLERATFSVVLKNITRISSWNLKRQRQKVFLKQNDYRIFSSASSTPKCYESPWCGRFIKCIENESFSSTATSKFEKDKSWIS